ncbi:FtsX-like permease family protein [Candidatus Falkowbacteria bacterium]|nr:FtsX-like permease family protein [Candidatus Falkowbacteria bacterium]
MNHSFLRVLKFAFQDFYRNFWLSLATITVLVLALLSVNILISLNAISSNIVASVKDKVDVSVFFKKEASAAAINNFQEKMKLMPEVKAAIFIAKDQALDSFKLKHEDDPAIMEALKEVGANPLLDTLVIKARNTEDYAKILAILSLEESQKIIKYQNYTDHQKIIDNVNSISNRVEKVSLILTAVFSLIALLIVFNAVRVMIYTHREEIAVMRLVGASNSFIRAPFLVEACLYSVFALILATAILYGLTIMAGPYLNSFLETYNFSLANYFNQNFVKIFLSELAAVALLNIVSSGIAVGKYLKV